LHPDQSGQRQELYLVWIEGINRRVWVAGGHLSANLQADFVSACAQLTSS
jgi:hypothetical protein